MGRRKVLNRILRPIGFGAARLVPPHGDVDILELAQRYKSTAVPRISARLAYTIQRGPFAGTILPPNGAWSELDLLPKLLGSYEAETFPVIEDAIAAAPDFVINIGASEGYYAVGLKRRLPDAQVFAFDIDPQSRNTLRDCAAANGVEVVNIEDFAFGGIKVSVPNLTKARAPFFVIDCEGCEVGVAHLPSDVIRKSRFLIELHDLYVPGISESVSNALRHSHDLTIISQATRQVDDFPELADLPSVAASVLLDELRADRMQWLYAVPK